MKLRTISLFFMTLFSFSCALSMKRSHSEMESQQIQIVAQDSALLSLPHETLFNIFGFLTKNHLTWCDAHKTLKTLSRTCKQLLQLIGNEKEILRFTATLAHYYAATGDLVAIINLTLDHKVINSHDHFSMRPVHYAAYYNNKEVVQLFRSIGFCDHKVSDKKTLKECFDSNNPNKLFCVFFPSIRLQKASAEKLIQASKDNNKEQLLLTLTQDHHALNNHNVMNYCNEIFLKPDNNRNIAEQCLLFVLKVKIEDFLRLDFTNEDAMLNVINLGIACLANLNVCNSQQWTPLKNAAYSGFSTCVQKLIESKADLNIADQEGYTPLMSAISQGHTACALPLIKEGAKLDQQENDGLTACMIAAREGNLECIKELIQQKADLNIQAKATRTNDFGGFSALHFAAYYGHKEVVSALLDAGANKSLRTATGQTARQLAQKSDFTDIVTLLS